MCRLVCNRLEYRHSAEISDHRSGLLCTNNGALRSARQTFQRCAVFLWHATKEEVTSNACPADGKDSCLIIWRPARIGSGKWRRRQTVATPYGPIALKISGNLDTYGDDGKEDSACMARDRRIGFQITPI